jgi:hypothetical protein
MPPTANVFWSESLPPQLSLGKDAGCCQGLLVIVAAQNNNGPTRNRWSFLTHIS